MKIFISYANKDRDLAERLSLGLENEGDKVFFDRATLHPGESFDDRIRESILRCHLMVFLISHDSLRPGAYTLTELGFAQERWPHPGGHVLPVLVDDTAICSIPPYLSAVSILDSPGNTVAEVLRAVNKRRIRHRRAVAVRLAVGVCVLLPAVMIGWLQFVPKEPLVIKNIDVMSAAGILDNDDFIIDVTIENRTDEALTLVGLSPRFDAKNTRFTGTVSEWININGGQTKTVSVSTSVVGETSDTPLDWRFCYYYVSTESIYMELNALKLNVDMFMAKNRIENCGTSRPWNPD